jgi:bifunctional DNase/RNase
VVIILGETVAERLVMLDEFQFDPDDELPDDLFREISEESPERGIGDLDEKEVEVVNVYESRDPGGMQPSEFVVLLRDKNQRSVLILIGKFEAMAISLAIEGASAGRPLTHDLLNNVIARMGGVVERILIDDLWNNKYYAKITVSTADKTIEFDSRPSDAIALALRAKAPIFMAESVLQKASVREE